MLLSQIKRPEPFLVAIFFRIRIGRNERDGPKNAALLVLVLGGLGGASEEHASRQQEVPHALHWVDS